MSKAQERCRLNEGFDFLKGEQLERIKQRDAFLNLNIVAVGIVAAIATEGPTRAAAWLAIPWVTVLLGWAYLSNDDKVTAISQHMRAALDPSSPLLAWESGPKGFLAPKLRRSAENVVFIVSFIAPTPVAIALYLSSQPSSTPKTLAAIVVLVCEIALDVGLGALFAGSAIHRYRVRTADAQYP
jgi:hypothetical protein